MSFKGKAPVAKGSPQSQYSNQPKKGKHPAAMGDNVKRIGKRVSDASVCPAEPV